MAFKSQPTVTRPANVTAYTAGDVVGSAAAAITFLGMGSTIGRDILITSADLRINIAAVPSGMTSFRLHLYNVTPPSALADNAVWDLPAGDRASYLGYIDLGTPVDAGSTLYIPLDQISKQVRLGSTETALYGYLVTNGGFTPSAPSTEYVPALHSIELRN